jgi:hypothetical protein
LLSAVFGDAAAPLEAMFEGTEASFDLEASEGGGVAKDLRNVLREVKCLVVGGEGN